MIILLQGALAPELGFQMPKDALVMYGWAFEH